MYFAKSPRLHRVPKQRTVIKELEAKLAGDNYTYKATQGIWTDTYKVNIRRLFQYRLCRGQEGTEWMKIKKRACKTKSGYFSNGRPHMDDRFSVNKAGCFSTTNEVLNAQSTLKGPKCQILMSGRWQHQQQPRWTSQQGRWICQEDMKQQEKKENFDCSLPYNWDDRKMSPILRMALPTSVTVMEKILYGRHRAWTNDVIPYQCAQI